jgi:chaperone BCS1
MFNATWHFISSQISTNQFLTGGAVIGAVGFLIAYLRHLPGGIWNWCKRRCVIELDIPDKDEAFKWLDEWLSYQNYQKRCRLLTIYTSRKRRDRIDNCPVENDVDYRARPTIRLSPAPGTHYFFYRGRFVILRRERKDGSEKQGSMLLGFRETFNFKIFSRNRQLVMDLLEEARELAHPKTDDRISVFVPMYGDWVRVTRKLPRPITSVILANNLVETTLNDVQTFRNSEKWYNTLGIPYRRGYLLCGPPGNGKSSLVMALASELHLDICVLNLSASGLSDDRLIELMLNLPEGAILLIEDIDCVFQHREKKDDRETVTFSGLLNAIDGVMSNEGRLLFMTTNHIDKLDPALIRPGRCDVHLDIGPATPDQARQLFSRFFPNNDVESEVFGRLIQTPISMAEIQGHLLKYRDNVQDAVKNWKSV